MKGAFIVTYSVPQCEGETALAIACYRAIMKGKVIPLQARCGPEGG